MKIIPTILSLALLATLSFAEQDESTSTSMANVDLAELDRQLTNPLANIWSLTFQNNTGVNAGDAVDGTEYSNVLFFQPFMPFQIGSKKQTMLTLRPVFPLVTQPIFKAPDLRNSSNHKTGLGDIQLLTLAGPNRGEGIIWGAGITAIFPTASDDSLGRGKYQAGPAAMLFSLKRPWTIGAFVQHWNSFAGDDDRSDVNHTDIQYVIRRAIPGAMSIGMGPTVSIDWDADADNQLTFPIGLGITKTTRWNKIPIKLRAEVHYSVISPDDYGEEWNFRLQITPVITSPFK